MGRDKLKTKSLYDDECIMLTTKHAKSIAIGPPFLEKLGATVLEYVADTDKLGTFSGEIEREGNSVDCARKKCEWSLNQLENKIDFALASEGSFGPHPFMPFLPCDNEVLYFIDRKRNFDLYSSCLSEKTNYRMQSLSSMEELKKFAKDALFPSHALILRANNREIKNNIFKGIVSLADLEEAFNESIRYSSDKKVWVETDMRAQFNPSRMNIIAELAAKLAEQLRTHCPKCDNPGWGKVNQEKGLPCAWCGEPTELVKSEIFSCVKCDYQESRVRSDGKQESEPTNCRYCNP